MFETGFCGGYLGGGQEGRVSLESWMSLMEAQYLVWKKGKMTIVDGQVICSPLIVLSVGNIELSMFGWALVGFLLLTDVGVLYVELERR